MNLAHISPFVQASREKFSRDVRAEAEATGVAYTDDQFAAIVESRVRDDIKKGIQTIQYQLITLLTTNGQAPFVTVGINLADAPEGQPRDDLYACAIEMLEQRYEGVKAPNGAWVTPAFPKIIVVLDEDNITTDSKYYDLIRTSAKVTARRLVPDYVSAKIMRKYKLSKGEVEGEGDVYVPMGCVHGDEIITWRDSHGIHVESFWRMWQTLSAAFGTKIQPNREKDLYIDLDGIEIFDHVNSWTKCKRLIRNADSTLIDVTFSNGRSITCTPDHPFETENRGIVHAIELAADDIIAIDKTSNIDVDARPHDTDLAWLDGLLLCDGCYDKHLSVSLAMNGEDDIATRFTRIMDQHFGLAVETIEQHRERKGDYKDLYVRSNGTSALIRLMCNYIARFGGIKKMDRHIPTEAFTWDAKARTALLAGMIDADGYLNDSSRMTCVQIGSTNRELATQQMLLAQSLGMRASMYQNHYKGSGRADTVRYMVTFYPTEELVHALACEKKRAKFQPSVARKNASVGLTDTASVTSITIRDDTDFSYDVTTASEHFTVSGIWSHNCRSFLTPDRSGNGCDNVARAKNWQPDTPKYWGRFNVGVTTINLADVALSSNKDFDEFWRIFEERLELCHKSLKLRYERLSEVTSDVAPILWQHGALARLEPGEKIYPLFFNGNATISLGYAALYECVKYMTGFSHTDHENGGYDFAIAVMQKMNDKCNEWKAAENIDYSIYGTPIESTTYKFAKCLQRRFGTIPGITDHGYITNSYHQHKVAA